MGDEFVIRILIHIVMVTIRAEKATLYLGNVLKCKGHPT